MDPTEPLTSIEKENLVAYLDGELDEAATEQIERTLAKSPEARHEVEMLTRTWEMLNVLPTTKASDEFSERTLSTIEFESLRQSQSGPVKMLRGKRGLWTLLWGIGLVLAAFAGYSATRHWIADDSQQIVEELPLIEEFDVYSDVSDIEFLRELQKSGVFDEELKKNNEDES